MVGRCLGNFRIVEPDNMVSNQDKKLLDDQKILKTESGGLIRPDKRFKLDHELQL